MRTTLLHLMKCTCKSDYTTVLTLHDVNQSRSKVTLSPQGSRGRQTLSCLTLTPLYCSFHKDTNSTNPLLIYAAVTSRLFLLSFAAFAHTSPLQSHHFLSAFMHYMWAMYFLTHAYMQGVYVKSSKSLKFYVINFYKLLNSFEFE